MEMLKLAQGNGARCIFIVGTGRNVGKSTAMRAIYEAACSEAIAVALASVGAAAKPKLWLRSRTVFATANALLPASPAAEILKLSPLQSPAGAILYARVATDGYFELSGPPTASGVREVVDELKARVEITIVDGAVDRIAALAGSDGAIIVSGGAADAPTMEEAVAEIAALVARLRAPAFDPNAPAIHLEGALTPAAAFELIARKEARQVVVRDPTQIALGGRAASQALTHLKVRCRRPLRVIAATVASNGPDRHFEPRRFGNAVAAATQLPTFDVYRSAQAA
jgi:hypothetical protein